MAPEVLLVAFGLISALSWGLADFSGGLASRRSPVLGIVFVSQVIGGPLALVLALALAQPLPSWPDVAWALLAGTFGPGALVCFYRALAVGRMNVVAPITGVVSAAIPVAVTAAILGLPAPAPLAGIGLALVSVGLVTQAAGSTSGGKQGIGLAFLAGCGFGAFFLALAQVGPASIFWSLAVVRVSDGLLLAVAVRLSRRPWRPDRSVARLVVVAGVLDMGGNLWFLLASQQGRIDIAAVLSSLYPVATVFLSTLLLREPMRRLQVAGVVTGVVAIWLIGSG